MSLKGRMFTGKLENLASTIRDNFIYATLSKLGSGKVALDVVQKKYAQVSTGNIVEAGSTDNLLKKTGHGLKPGYLIRLTSTSNSIVEEEIVVDEVVDANIVRLAAFLSAALVAGDTFDIYKPVAERVASDGSSLSTLIAPPIQIIKNGVATDVASDTNPANVVPVPVELVGVGTTINLYAGDIGVQLSDQGVNFDIVRLGDGTYQLAMTSNGEAKVHDADSLTQLLAIAGKDFSTETTQLLNKALLTTIAGKDFATQTTLALLKARGDLLATEAKQDTMITAQGSTNTKLDTIIAKDFATSAKQDTANTSLATIAGKDFSTSAKQDTGNTSLGNIDTNIGAKADAVATTDTGTFSLIAFIKKLNQSITSLIGKLPSALGQTTKSGSLSVTVASDQTLDTQNKGGTTGSVNKGTLAASGTAAHAAPANALGFFLKVLGASAGDLYWEIGAAASTGSSDLTSGQGTAFIPCAGTVNLLADANGASYCLQWIIK